MIPVLTKLRQDDTHRLIPARYGDDGVLRRLAQPDREFEALLELEGATNDRLLGEANLLPGISIHELLFGVAHAEIVNAAFTHAHPGGSRFNGPERGAWYAAFDLETAKAEVLFHKTQELLEIGWEETETFSLVDYAADFRGNFHDLRKRSGTAEYLDPGSYIRSQALAGDLLAKGSAGIVYPSVRRPQGTCLVCFRPALVTNVRQGGTLTITVNERGRGVSAKAPRRPGRRTISQTSTAHR